jgi:hypothetical protein
MDDDELEKIITDTLDVMVPHVDAPLILAAYNKESGIMHFQTNVTEKDRARFMKTVVQALQDSIGSENN